MDQLQQKKVASQAIQFAVHMPITFSRTGVTGGGTFSQGMGVLTLDHQRALLWLYNRTFKQEDMASGMPFGTVNNYPHRSILALVNWPFGAEELHPSNVLPEVVADHYWNKVDIRRGWDGSQDTFISVLTKSAGGHYISKPDIRILDRGNDIRLPFVPYGFLQNVTENESNIIINTDGASLGFDFSGASGSEFLVVCYRGIDPNDVLTKKERQALEKKPKRVGNKKTKQQNHNLQVFYDEFDPLIGAGDPGDPFADDALDLGGDAALDLLTGDSLDGLDGLDGLGDGFSGAQSNSTKHKKKSDKSASTTEKKKKRMPIFHVFSVRGSIPRVMHSGETLRIGKQVVNIVDGAIQFKNN